MRLVYTVVISILRILYGVASWFHPKAKKFVNGRRQQKEEILKKFPLPDTTPLIWFHCASLGEFEQGRPVIEAIKTSHPAVRILVTFFSPSGYEVIKNYEHADYVFYLPWDTRRNASRFIQRIQPAVAVFVKYEFWYHYTMELSRLRIPLISISAIFRADQIFFKPYGGLFRSMLQCFTQFFVQNLSSVDLLKSIGIKPVTLAGDTRFDRVQKIFQEAAEVPIAGNFKGGKKIMVIGSAWADDLEVLYPFINAQDDLKFIIAPHEPDEKFLLAIESSVREKSIRYSQALSENPGTAKVLIIDNVGLLSRLYRYGEFAFVGGGYKEGLHNILEAACCGVPIFFGNKAYQKYEEANTLIQRGGAFDIPDDAALQALYHRLNSDRKEYERACEVTRQYVTENLGATEKIVAYCQNILNHGR